MDKDDDYIDPQKLMDHMRKGMWGFKADDIQDAIDRGVKGEELQKLLREAREAFREFGRKMNRGDYGSLD